MKQYVFAFPAVSWSGAARESFQISKARGRKNNTSSIQYARFQPGWLVAVLSSDTRSRLLDLSLRLLHQSDFYAWELKSTWCLRSVYWFIWLVNQISGKIHRADFSTDTLRLGTLTEINICLFLFACISDLHDDLLSKNSSLGDRHAVGLVKSELVSGGGK